jgi:hypothetical protein
MTSSQGQTSQTGAGRMGSVCSAFAVAVVISVASVPTAAAERRCSEHGKYLAEFAIESNFEKEAVSIPLQYESNREAQHSRTTQAAQQ